MGLLNCTPHTITLVVEGKEIQIPPSGYLIRVKATERSVGSILYKGEKIPVVRTTLEGITIVDINGRELSEKEIKELFDGVEGVIVPLLLKDYKEEVVKLIGKRVELYAPNTAKAIRDKEGKIVGVPSLIWL